MTILPTVAPASAGFVEDPFLTAEDLPLTAPGAVPPALDSGAGPVPEDVRTPLLEAYRTSLLEPDVTAVLEARARTLGLPVPEIRWTHDVSGPWPLADALAALAQADMPSMSTEDLARAQASANALPRDLQVALAKLVWNVVDAGQLQAQAFAPLSPDERRALATLDDPTLFASAVQKVDTGAVLGAARAVDQAVKEAEPVLRKWSLLLEARRAIGGRALTPAGLAAGASMLGDETVTTNWALGLADRPHTPAGALPELTLGQALGMFYVANGIPITDDVALGLVLLEDAHPAVAKPLARAVVATTFAEAYALQGGGDVDPAEFLRLDAEAARIATSDGASADDLALLERYLGAARVLGDTPTLTAVELLLQASRDLSAAAPSARGVSGPALYLPADTTRRSLPAGGSIDVHNERNGTSVSIDVDGDGRHEFWTPASQTQRVVFDQGNCTLLVYQELNNDGKVQEREKQLDVPSMCSETNDVTLQDPYGYFVVGGKASTHYGPDIGAVKSSTQNRKSELTGVGESYNGTFARTIVDAFLGSLTQGRTCLFNANFCIGSNSGSSAGSNGFTDDVVFDRARRSNVSMNSQHYQVLTWDLGGDDRYTNNAGGTYNWTEVYTLERIKLGDFAGVVALAVDEAGNDTYVGSRNYTVGSAQMGVGLVVDREGNDTYSGPKDAVASSTGVRRRFPHGMPGMMACADPRGGCGAPVEGDVGNEDVGARQVTRDPESARRADGSSVGVDVAKFATAFAAIVDAKGSDSYRGGDRSLAFANASMAFLIDLEGADRYASGEFAQGVANSTSFDNAAFATPLFAVAALVDAKGDDAYTYTGRDNMTQGRGIANGTWSGSAGLPVNFLGGADFPSVGLLLDLGGEDTGIRRNGNVTAGPGLVEAGFRTRHVWRGQQDASQPQNRPDSGISLALDLDTRAPTPEDFRPAGTLFAAPASHVDMDEDPFFALDLYVDVPRLFVLATEANTTFEQDAVVLIDLGGGDTYKATVGAATFDWNNVTSHPGFYRGEVQRNPAPEGSTPLRFVCSDDENVQRPCTIGAYETGRVAPVALALDLEGSDTYALVKEKGAHVRGFGYGYGGVGALYDLGRLASSDRYNVSRMGLGAAEFFGAGILYDAEGDDDYRMVDGKHKELPAESNGLGFAHTGGVGIAIDARRYGGPADDRYNATNMSLGSILVDLRQEYAAFIDAGGSDSYRGGPKSLAYLEDVTARPETARLRGIFGERTTVPHPQGGSISVDALYCYYLRYGNSDTQATFIDDGFEADRYAPDMTTWGDKREDDSEWRASAPARTVDPENDPTCYPLSATPPQAGGDGASSSGQAPIENDADIREGSAGYALGVDNLDAYAERHAAAALRDPAGAPDREADTATTSTLSARSTTYLPLDEVFAARAILVAPAAIYVDEAGNGLSTSSIPTMSGKKPVQVVVVKGANSVLTNTRSFAEFLIQDTTPRLTCSYVPQPTQPVRELGSSENPDATEGGRPAVPGATSAPDVSVAGMSYRQYRRASAAPGYCTDADNERDAAQRSVEDPCVAEEHPTPAGPLLGSLDVCEDYVDPNPFTDAARRAVDDLDPPPSLPLVASQYPVLAEAFRLVAGVDADLAPFADDVEDALTAALARAMRGDTGAAEAILAGSFSTMSASSAPGNPCDAKTNTRAATDDCRDVGTVSFHVLRNGRETYLGSWDNRLERGAAGDNATVCSRAGDTSCIPRNNQNREVDPSGAYYRHLWLTNATTARSVAFPDGPYDLVVRTTYNEDGNVGTGAASVPVGDRVPFSDEVLRRIHDEYGYYPGENWLNVSVDNRPAFLPALSSPGHFRPGVDTTKRVHLVFSEPVKASIRLERPGVTTAPIADQTSPHFAECRTYAPALVGVGDALDFEIPVQGLGPGQYTLVVEARDRDTTRWQSDCTRQSVTTFRIPVMGDAHRPFADLALPVDHLNNGSRVRCATGSARACLDLTLVADAGVADQSPIASWTVGLDITKSNGDVVSVPPTTSASNVYTVPASLVFHGATYRFTVSAVDAAGNEQLQPAVRDVVYDSYAPRVKDVVVPPTVRPDGTLVVRWGTSSNDAAFPSDVAGVYIEWATGPVPRQGESVTRTWRPVPARFVDAGLGEARIPVADVMADFVSEARNAHVARNWTENHTLNLTDTHRFDVRIRAFDVHDNWEATDPWDPKTVNKTADGARFDTVAPNLTGAPAIRVTHDAATLDFEFSEPGTAVVRYGLEGSDLGLVAEAVQRGNGSVQSVSLPSLRQASTYAFRVVARDLVGNERAFGNFTFSTDRVVDVQVTAPKEGVVASGAQRVEWSAKEYRFDPYIVYQLKISTDGGKTFPYDLTQPNAKPLYERSSPLRVFVFDTREYPDTTEAVVRVLANNSLNKGAPLAFDSPVFRIDNAPPLTTAVLRGEGSNGWFRTPVEVAFVPTDRANVSAVRSVEYSTDNVTFTSVEGPAATTTSITVATEGRHVVYFRAVDALGNVEPVRTVRFNVDLGLPEALVVLDAGETASADRTVDLEIAARDAQSGVASVVVRTTGLDPLVVPGERFRNGAFVQPFTFPEGDGERTVQVDVTDVAGNRATVQRNVRVDSTPPAFEETVFDRVAFETATGTVRLAEPASLTVYVKRGEDVGYQSRLDYGEATTAHRIVLNALVPSTDYVLRLVATDPLGNKAETTHAFTTLEDLAAPTEPVSPVASDGGHGALEVTWTPATDNVGIDHYVVFRSLADTDAVDYAPVGRAYRTAFLDDDVVPGTRYAYRVQAVDAAGNPGPTSALAVGRATTAPTLDAGMVDPLAAPAAETFTYTITYRDGDGDTPAFVRIYIDGEVHDMVKERGATGADAYREGVRYVYHATLEPTRLSTGVHTFHFEASDGSSVVRFPAEGLSDAVGPAVFASADLSVDGSVGLGAAIRDAPAYGFFGAVGALAAVAVALRRRWA